MRWRLVVVVVVGCDEATEGAAAAGTEQAVCAWSQVCGSPGGSDAEYAIHCCNADTVTCWYETPTAIYDCDRFDPNCVAARHAATCELCGGYGCE